MTRSVWAISVALTAFLWTSCCQNPGNTNSGEIIAVIDNDCIEWLDDETMVIRDDSTLNTILRESCRSYIDVDFSQKSVLAYSRSGGCVIYFERVVSRDTTTRTVKYSLSMEECGWCKVLRTDYNMVTVPFIPEDYTVTFDQVP